MQIDKERVLFYFIGWHCADKHQHSVGWNDANRDQQIVNVFEGVIIAKVATDAREEDVYGCADNLDQAQIFFTVAKVVC